MKYRAATMALIAGLTCAQLLVAAAPSRSARPIARSEVSQIQRPDAFVLITRSPGVQISLRPIARPANLFSVSGIAPNTPTAQTPSTAQPVAARGSVCGVRGIKGRRIAAIPGRLSGCGVQSPVQITSVAGVELSQAATMDCTTAKALNKWVKNSVKPTVGRLGGGVSGLRVVAHYSCRTRNSQPGAKISEHGKGHAIDIAAINLRNGSSLSVLQGWKDRVQGKMLRAMHKGACGPFGTVLGPKSDRHHQDHFHLDTARYRGGSYCR